jgi:hypothetical protein
MSDYRYKSDYELLREREDHDSHWHDSDVRSRWAHEDRVREIDYELHRREDERSEEAHQERLAHERAMERKREEEAEY